MIRKSMFWCLIAAIVVLMAVAAHLFAPSIADTIRSWWSAPSFAAEELPGREIDTNGQLWRVGRLGMFFRYGYFGLLIFLGPIAWLSFLLTTRKRPRWQNALFFTGTLLCLLISIKGYYNWRYAFTLVPAVVSLVLFVAWTASGRCVVRAVLVGLACVLVICGFTAQRGRYDLSMQFLTSYASESDIDLPFHLIAYLNSVSSETNRGVLSLGNTCFGYYLRGRVVDFKHPEVAPLLRSPDEHTLASLVSLYGIRYIAARTSSEWQMERSSLGPFIDLIRSRTLKVNDGLFFLRCIDPGLTEDEERLVLAQYENIAENPDFECISEHDSWHAPWRLYTGSMTVNPARIEPEIDERTGKRSAKVTGDNFHLVQDVQRWSDFKGQTVTAFVRMKTHVPGKFAMELYDGVAHSLSFHPGHGDWLILRAILRVSEDADRLELRAVGAERTGEDDEALVDDILFVKGNWFMPRDLLELNPDSFAAKHALRD